jgi:hypothetical protein
MPFFIGNQMKDLFLTAKAESNGKQVKILAYSGGLMRVPSWGLIAIDLDNLDTSGQIKILVDHENSVSGLIGYGQAFIEKRQLVITGKILDSTEAGENIIKLHRDGVQLEASVGVDVFESESIRTNEKRKINGKTVKSEYPYTLIKKGKLREVSIVGIGCDGDTQVNIAAKYNSNKGIDNMKTEQEIRETERKRLSQIESICAGFNNSNEVDNLRQQAIEEKISIDQLRDGVLEAVRRNQRLEDLRASRSTVPAFVRGTSVGLDNRKVLAAAALLMSGLHKTAEKHYDENVLQAASDLHVNCALNLCTKAVELAGQQVPSGQNDMLKAAFSTTSLPYALADSATKELIEAYDAAVSTWRSVGLVKPTRNFHPHSAIRGILKNGIYQPVPGSGEIKHASLEDELMTYQSDTRGLMFSVDRKTIINDDIGIIFDLQRTLGLNAARTVNKIFWETLRAATSFFSAGNGNYLSGSDTILAVPGLSKAILTLREMVDGDGNPISNRPVTLAVPPSLEATARALLSSIELAQSTDDTPTGNPWKNINLELEVEPLLGATAGGSDKEWYLFGDRQIAPTVIVSFLNGVERPTVETADTAFNTLGQQYRAYLDFGVDMGDKRGGIKMKGEE